MLSPVTHEEAERDRKDCIALDARRGSDRRELAQWLLDHPHYSCILVAHWLSCSRNRIYYLRRWAEKGFVGKPHDLRNHPDKRWGENPQPREPKLQDEPAEADPDMAPPEVIEESVLYCLERMNVHARMFKKQFKATPFDAEARKRIAFAIERMIRNWRQTQSILTREKRR